MIKFMFVARRAAGQTRQGALDHLRDVHAKMVVCPPPDAGPMPLDYVQNHVIHGAYPEAAFDAIERDLVTELWFDSIDHLHASTATPYYLKKLRPDEPRFVDDATVAKLMVRPHVLQAGDEGHFKTFVFVARGDADPAAWGSAKEALATAFGRAAGLVAAVENEVIVPPTGARPFADVVLEGWFARPDAAVATMRDAIARLTGSDTDGIAPDRCFAVAAEQYNTPRLRALHDCAAR